MHWLRTYKFLFFRCKLFTRFWHLQTLLRKSVEKRFVARQLSSLTVAARVETVGSDILVLLGSDQHLSIVLTLKFSRALCIDKWHISSYLHPSIMSTYIGLIWRHSKKMRSTVLTSRSRLCLIFIFVAILSW